MMSAVFVALFLGVCAVAFSILKREAPLDADEPDRFLSKMLARFRGYTS
jgi:hypothetical protein